MLKAQYVLALAAALAAAGCQGAGGLPGLGGRSAAAPTTQVSYAGGGALEVVSTDPRPITRVEVVGPSGPIPAAVSMHRETVDPYPYGSQAAGGPLVGPAFGFGFGAGRWSGSRFSRSGVYLGGPRFGFGRPYPYHGYGAAPDPGAGAMRTTARVTLDDPAAYERQWRGATVRVHFGDGPDAPTTDLPAPAPSR
jgi:hypothetical protein